MRSKADKIKAPNPGGARSTSRQEHNITTDRNKNFRQAGMIILTTPINSKTIYLIHTKTLLQTSKSAQKLSNLIPYACPIIFYRLTQVNGQAFRGTTADSNVVKKNTRAHTNEANTNYTLNWPKSNPNSNSKTRDNGFDSGEKLAPSTPNRSSKPHHHSKFNFEMIKLNLNSL